MIIVGIQRAGGSFETPDKKVINFDNVYVHAVSGERDKSNKSYDYSFGKWVATYKIKCEDFLEAFNDLKSPFDEAVGIDVVPYYNEYGKCVGFMRLH